MNNNNNSKNLFMVNDNRLNKVKSFNYICNINNKYIKLNNNKFYLTGKEIDSLYLNKCRLEINEFFPAIKSNINYKMFINEFNRNTIKFFYDKKIENINILYVNARGLNEIKQSIVLENLVYYYDIIFISETWFINFNQVTQHKNFVVSTPLNYRKGMRQKDGIYCIANPTMKKQISILQTTLYTITIKLFDTIIKAIYYPPSLSLDKIKEEMYDIYVPDIIIGDFNINPYEHYPLKKYNILKENTINKLLTFIPPITKEFDQDFPKLDHVFAKSSLHVQAYSGRPPFCTDHPSLEVKISIKNKILNINDNKNNKYIENNNIKINNDNNENNSYNNNPNNNTNNNNLSNNNTNNNNTNNNNTNNNNTNNINTNNINTNNINTNNNNTNNINTNNNNTNNINTNNYNSNNNNTNNNNNINLLKKNYYINNLKNDLTRNIFKNKIDLLFINLLELTLDIEKQYYSSSKKIRKDFIEFIDEILVTSLQDCCKEVLGEKEENTSVNQTKNYRNIFNFNNNNLYNNNNSNSNKTYNNKGINNYNNDINNMSNGNKINNISNDINNNNNNGNKTHNNNVINNYNNDINNNSYDNKTNNNYSNGNKTKNNNGINNYNNDINNKSNGNTINPNNNNINKNNNGINNYNNDINNNSNPNKTNKNDSNGNKTKINYGINNYNNKINNNSNDIKTNNNNGINNYNNDINNMNNGNKINNINNDINNNNNNDNKTHNNNFINPYNSDINNNSYDNKTTNNNSNGNKTKNNNGINNYNNDINNKSNGNTINNNNNNINKNNKNYSNNSILNKNSIEYYFKRNSNSNNSNNNKNNNSNKNIDNNYNNKDQDNYNINDNNNNDNDFKNNLSNNIAIRLFKNHLKKSNTLPKYIKSSNPKWDDVEDAFKFYNDFFKSVNHKLNPNGIRNKYIGLEDKEFYNFVTEEVVINKINQLPSSKSCGMDGIHIVMLKSLNDTFLPLVLTKFFKMCIKFGITPLSWNNSMIYPIPKKEKSCFIKDFRPIALTNIFRKLFESILMDFINKNLKDYFKLCGNQAGFRRGYSTLTHAIVSSETASQRNQYHIFLDLKKAYDSVPLIKLIEKLEERHLPGGILSLITSLFTECKTRIIVNKKLTKEIFLDRGLMQGSVLSPLLFNVFIDDLAIKLTNKYPNDPLPHCLLFADDIKLNHFDKIKLQEMLNICSNWADINGMEFNEKKSAVIEDTALPSISFYLLKNNKEVKLPVVPCYQYLGFPHTCEGIDWKNHLNDSANKALTLLKSLECYQDIWLESIKLIIFKTFIRPMMEYSAPLAFFWMKNVKNLKNKSSKPNYSEVETYHRVMEKGIQWILNHNRISNAFSLLHLPSTIMRLYILALKFKVHLSKMNEENPLHLLFHPKNNNIKPFTSSSFSYKVTTWTNFFYYKYFDLPLPPPPPVEHSYIRTENNKRIKTTYNHPLLYKLSSRINKMMKSHFKTTLIMDNCILPSARMTKTTDEEKFKEKIKSPDKCIFISNSEIRKRAIAWRLNAFGTTRICPICGDTFHRTHINKCNFLNYDPFYKIIKIKDIMRYENDKNEYPNLPETYNILDSLLNHQKYKTFGKFINKLYEFWTN